MQNVVLLKKLDDSQNTMVRFGAFYAKEGETDLATWRSLVKFDINAKEEQKYLVWDKIRRTGL